MSLTNAGPPAVTAEFESLCPECGDPFEQGDAIVHRDGQWVHEVCPDDELAWARSNPELWTGTTDDEMGY